MNIHAVEFAVSEIQAKCPRWTDEREALLRELYGAGRSYVEIAAMLGGFEHTCDGGFDAVKGKIARMKLSRSRSEWTPQRLDLLRELFPYGTFVGIAKTINAETGSDLTEGAVAGKSFRLGLTKGVDLDSHAWTSERLALLREFYPKGKTKQLTEAINQQTGAVFTKSAVINKARRLGLLVKRATRPLGADGGAASKIKIAKQPKPTDAAAVKKWLSEPPPPYFIGIPFLENTGCLYSKEIDGATLFCGQPKRIGSSYCVGCHVICWRPVERGMRPNDRKRVAA